MARSKQQQQHRPWSPRRRVNVRELRQRFLIVCEGEKTEPNYFRSFRVPKAVVDVRGVGRNTASLVRKALEIRDQDEYDQVWCVFDKDDFSLQNFNAALALAKQHDINVAYSNEAFELWYVLHFHYHQAASKRGRYAKLLTKLLNAPYQKSLPDMHERLEIRQEAAIRNAERLLSTYDPPDLARNNPSTTVHLLVNELNRFAV